MLAWLLNCAAYLLHPVAPEADAKAQLLAAIQDYIHEKVGRVQLCRTR